MIETGVLYQYLFRFHRLPLGELGNLALIRQPAVLHMLDKQITSPSHALEYSVEASDTSSCIRWLSQHLSVTEEVAGVSMMQFIASLKRRITEHGSVTWKHLGTWMLNESGQIFFNGDAFLSGEKEVLPAEKLIRAKATHEVLIGDQTYSGEALHQVLEKNKKKLPLSRTVIILSGAIAAAAFIIVLCFFMLPQFGHTHQMQPKLPLQQSKDTYKIIPAD